MTMDLESLRLIWWLILGVVVVVFTLCEGLALGVFLLLPLASRQPSHSRQMLQSIAPTSLLGLLWLLVLLATLFAVWPIVYAVSLAGFYTLLVPLLTVLCARTAALPLRLFELAAWEKYENRIALACGYLPAITLGIIAGNLLKGIPFHLESDMRILFLGDTIGLCNPFALLVAATFTALLAFYGSLWVQLNTEGQLRHEVAALSMRLALVFVVLFVLTGLWLSHLEGYHITSELLPNAASNPLAKFVKRAEGLWLDNYEHIPVLWGLPVFVAVAAPAAAALALRGKAYYAMLTGVLTVGVAVLTFGVSMFPFLLPSNISLNTSLSIWDSSASQTSAGLLLPVGLIAVPLIAVVTRCLFGFFNRQDLAKD
ncbi:MULTISPECIES: cytochrome d ubiquinol oxidase subunit II [Methylomonas]|uniref:cytochrome d ubiquinol oxidase subunit II n=1 Tax=Methylomonas TaxID=416 RepID=UPI001232CF31|nr:cytochrome d ubiquinol oxidase subunit II [Methylomonas rhizoryzae]